MSQERQKIFEDIKVSGVKFQLLLFFYNNPFTVDDLEGVSIWVGMHKDEIAGEMEQLCQMKLLVKHGSSNHVYYGLTEKPELLQAVHEFIGCFYSAKSSKAS